MGLFTVMLKDNIDLNPKSNFIQFYYHGTSCSMIQFKSNENEWTPFQIVDISKVVESSKKSKKLSPLPSEYTSEKDLFRDSGKSEKLWAALCNVNFSGITDFQELDSAFKYEITWLKQIFDSLQNYSTNDEATCNGWAAHQSSKKRGSKYPPGINTISTLTRDKVVTLNTQGHCMLGKIKCTKIINPDQTLVDCSD